MEKINWFRRAIEYISWCSKQKSQPLRDCKFEEIFIFRHLLEILGEEIFNNYLDSGISFEDFHKSFRQLDVYSGDKSGNLDMIMWHFIFISKYPQRLYHYIQDKNFDGSEKEKDFREYTSLCYKK